MAMRIALTLAGGVSLGAYQGGVAYELLWALSHRIDQQQRIIVDVMTGASAGSMTAAIMARTLLYDRDAAWDLHRAWVSGVGFDKLMAGEPTSSLLSDKLIWDLADDILKDPAAPYKAHPAAPDELRVVFTLSNLNGVNYGLGYTNTPREFDTTVFSDWIVFRLGQSAPAPPSRSALWDTLKRSAIASGAFPFAFPTVSVRRSLGDYRGSEIYDVNGARVFAYVDGGLFNNEPVGLAREIVDELEAVYPETRSDDRFYILVDPYVAATSSTPEFAEDPLSYRLVLGRLISAILGESSKRDWIRAMRVNKRLEWQDLFLRHLADIVAGTSMTDGMAFARRVGQLALEIARLKVDYEGRGQSPSDHLKQNMGRLGGMLSVDDPAAYAVIRSDPLRTEVFLNVVYIMESVAGLRKKERLDLKLIAPELGSLAGDFLGNFGGFFAEEWREHDWRRGRADVRDFIARLTPDHHEFAYTLDAPEKYVPDRDLRNVSEKDIPPEAVETLRRGIRNRITRLLSPERPGLFKRWGISLVSAYVANKLTNGLMKQATAGMKPAPPEASGRDDI